MHPQILLLFLLSLAAVVPWLPLPVLGIGAAMLLPLFARDARLRRDMLRAVRRVRWLLLSLAVLYLGFTPGELLWPSLGVFSPSLAGLGLAVHRSLVILVMALAATVYLHFAGRDGVIAGLLPLLRPLGVRNSGKIAARFLLVLERLPETETEMRLAKAARDGSRNGLLDAAALLVGTVERRAASAGDVVFTLPQARAVPAWQWLLPIALLSVGIVVISR